MSDAPPKVYRADEVTLNFGGKLIEGKGEDEFFSYAPSAPRASKMVGADGEVVVSQSADKSGEASITILATSDSNDVLQAALDRNERGPGMEFKPLVVRDLNGRAKHSWPHAWISEEPAVAYGKSGKMNVWKIGLARKLPGGTLGSAPAV